MACLTFVTLALRNGYCALTVDLRNAFNCVSRSSVLSAASGTPLSKYAQWAYGSHSLLHFGCLNVTSSCGVQQGDPAGPVLFAMALGAALRIARRSFSAGVLDFWYADDGTLVGPAKLVADAFRILEKSLSENGLCVNRTMCKLWIQEVRSEIHFEEIDCSVINDSADPLTILGFLIAGNTVALQSFVRKTV